MRFSHIIWDWNGTIVDDAPLSLEILNRTLAKRGIAPLTLERYRDTFDFPVSEFYESLGFDFSKESVEAVGRDFVEAYNKAQRDCPMRRGVLDMLRRIADSSRTTQSVLSAYEKNSLVSAMNIRGLGEFFDLVSGLDNIYAGSKEALGRAHIAKIGVGPGEVLMVGDTTHDFKTAQAMGVSCALLCGGHHSRRRLESTGAAVFSDIGELWDFLSV